MTVCVIKYCPNYTGRSKTDGKVTYHRIPTDPATRAQWIAIIRHSRGDSSWSPARHTYVCSDHFRQRDFYYGSVQERRRIQKNTLPTKSLYLSSPSSPRGDTEESDGDTDTHDNVEVHPIIGCKMDVESLIEAVKKRPTVWDRTCEHNKSRIRVEKSWREISIELNEDGHKLKRKWKYLRDNFATLLGKMAMKGIEEDGLTWPYYNSLTFLKGQVKPRTLVKNAEAGKRSHSNSTSDQGNDDSIDLDSDDDIPIKKERRHTLDSSDEGRSKGDPLNSSNKYFVPEMPIEYAADNDELDEHAHFFKSLLPHVRKIPQARLLTFRNNVQNLVEQFAYRS